MKERYLLEDGGDNSFSLITDYDGNDEQAFDVNVKSGEILPVLPLRNMVLFPGVFLPITVGRKSSLKLVRDADKKHKDIAVVCQRSAHTEDPKLEDLHNIGTVGRIVRILEMPDQTTTVILQGMKRLNLINIIETHPYLKGEIELLEEDIPSKDDKEFQALVETCKDLTMRYIKSSDVMHQDSAFAIKNINNSMFLVNFICSNLPFKKDEKMDLLSINSLRERTYHLLEILNREVQLAEIKASIQMRAREDIDQQQREYFLQQQIKTIQDELGGSGQEQEIEEMRQKAERMRWNAEVRETFLKELAKLERTHPQSPDYSVQLNYLQTMLNLPWGVYTTDNLNLKNAEKTLNKDHYGLEKVKERILEHLAVLKLKGDMKSPIICLYGPPGVGKTSLGKSIASALKRKYVRMSLGGVHDEAEIRGHRKTYIGAMPGRIIKSLIKAGASNPVFILDEIDKVSADRQGDPSSALLEVLDPEQNTSFHDNFLDVDYDLSKVLFIATANTLDTIPAPLLDRMEVIELGSYNREEKFQIAKHHLLSKQMKKHGLKGTQFKVQDAVLYTLIDDYTREAGVRELERMLASLCRKAVKELVSGTCKRVTITTKNLTTYLGHKKYLPDDQSKQDTVGIVNGLAWTSVGGVLMPLETLVLNGKGMIELTGSLGDVMKESAKIAVSYVRSIAKQYHIPEDFYLKNDLHIHAPEGAVPKDGPSAGVTMVTAIVSALSGIPVRHDVAMTGEITLHGKVLPIGGLPEKAMAAYKAGLKTVIIPKRNEPDLEDVDETVRNGLEFVTAENLETVLKTALVSVPEPIQPETPIAEQPDEQPAVFSPKAAGTPAPETKTLIPV